MSKFIQGQYVQLANLSEAQHTLIAEGFAFSGANLYHDTDFPDWKKYKYMGWDMNGDFRHSNSLHDFKYKGFSPTQVMVSRAEVIAMRVRPAEAELNASRELAKWMYTSKLGDCHRHNSVNYLRVPGGWIVDSVVFVPFNNEFQREEFFFEEMKLTADRVADIF